MSTTLFSKAVGKDFGLVVTTRPVTCEKCMKGAK